MLGILDDVRLIELANTLSAAVCAKLLADQGADTLKIEPPGRGDPTRHEPPFIGGEPHPDHSTVFLAYNTNKRAITLDVGCPAGRELFLRIVRGVDIVVESYTPGQLDDWGIGYDVLQNVNPRLIVTSIAAFGQTGPYRRYKGNDLVAQAVGGFLYAVTGFSDRPPMGTALDQMEITAAKNAAIATMAALFHQRETGEGQHIDVSMMETTVSVPSGLIHPYTFTGRVPRRGGGEQRIMDGRHLKTGDGEVSLTTAGTGTRSAMEVWADFLDEPRLADPKFATSEGQTEHAQELLELVEGKLKEWNHLDLMEKATAERLVVGPVLSPTQVIESPHLAARGCFVSLDHPEVGTLKYPGPGFLVDGINPAEGGRAAPRLGEHNMAVYCGELGMSIEELGLLRATGVI